VSDKPSSEYLAPHRARVRGGGPGFSLVELLVVLAVISIIAGIVVPLVVQARVRANEGAAIASMSAIRTAQSTFANTCARGGFAQSLDDLARPPTGTTESFISGPLGTNGVSQSGYIANVSADVGATMITPAANTCNASAADAMSSYFAERHPIGIGVTGQRSFAIATSGTIYFKDDGSIIAPGLAGATALR
jgi:prepilin-type N-terminal cleavage/methylation domain-containing protein